MDIRYIAPWKKWVVWDDTHWQVDTGALLYTKHLEIVRNIYAELYKTADYRDRMDIEKYAIQSGIHDSIIVEFQSCFNRRHKTRQWFTRCLIGCENALRPERANGHNFGIVSMLAEAGKRIRSIPVIQPKDREGREQAAKAKKR
ncbi:MAG: hypothetical protein LBG57_12185 [Treponema sp.]|nr:hypothetical protein [Treponema sp.]